MSYSEEDTQTFYYFSEDEKKVIEKKLKELGYGWETNNVCGSCCGMYADEYWVGGIGGKFKKEDKEKMYKFLKRKKISCSFDNYETISADPDDGEKYQIHE